MVVAFDLGSEEFREIASLPGHEWYRYEFQRLCYLNGRISCISSYTSVGRLVGELRVKEDYGVESSWTKLASIDINGLSGLNFRPLAFSEKSGKMLLQIGWKKLAVYDVETKSIKDVSINDERTCVTSCACVGGLVSPCS
ncbi:OLC1v1035554C1 [Oldenlandia corymbosa var. corymbosa]|uniref:OLC1v1035554C1 n=1 Tax=Oldenlandia corymbosa var. corymbosa TaxID=529605 RepID=A0AAV1CT90_OLDCO|nr:OLC1v1035554C1 [Oldenlandia corymbosa var. corymbosa]